jgi:hypothetical protein
MPDIEFVRGEIERMRLQVHRQRGEIRQLQRAGISTTSAEALLDRMLNNIDGLGAERDRLKKSCLVRSKGECWAGVGGDMPEPLKWYDDNADNPPWIKALAEVRRLAPREGWRYHHVRAIIVSIDQYAEAALGNREFFLNKPYGIGGGMKDNIP